MGKKKELTTRVKISCPEYNGYLDEMPEELKVAREARKSKK